MCEINIKLFKIIITPIIMGISIIFLTQAITPSRDEAWGQNDPRHIVITSPKIVNVGTVSEGVSTIGGRTMWQSPNGQVHLLAAFGADPWYAHYVNLSTGAHALIKGAAHGATRGWAYNPQYDRLYVGTNYATYAGSLIEFNPNTQTVVKIADQTISSTYALIIGDDNRVYCGTRGYHVYSYDPGVGMPGGWKDYGVVLAANDPTKENVPLAADKNYVYCGVQKSNGNWTLVISPTSGSPHFSEWQFGNAGDTNITISKELNTSKWILTRTLANGSTKVYYLQNGTYTDTGKSFIQDEWNCSRAPNYCATADTESNYYLFADTYSWEPDLTDLFPIKSIHEYSTIRYRKQGTQTWSESTVNFNGPWVPQMVQCLAPQPDQSDFAATANYNASVCLDPNTFSPAYLGANCASPYKSMLHPSGEIYIGGYPDRVLRYNPLLPWTLNSTNATPRLPSDATKPNPYFIKMTPGNTLHYRHGLDYDFNGNVWIGGNTTRNNPDYGDVMCYNPDDGSVTYVFPGWKSAGITFRNLCAADSRKRICVSDNNGHIWIVDAATKTVDPSPITPISGGGSKTYMVEVENDVVFGIVISDSGNKVIRFKPSTKQILTLQNLGVSGTPFGFADSQYARMNYKLEKGPDGYVWMFVGDTLYRVNPTTCAFSKVVDAPHSKLKFDANNVDLLFYCIEGTTDFRYIPGILEPGQ